MKKLTLAFVVAVGSVAVVGAANGLAAAKGDTSSYAGKFPGTDATLNFGVVLRENGKPKEIFSVDPNDVPLECDSGPTTASPSLGGETAAVKRRRFEMRLGSSSGFKFVLKGEFKPGGKAKGTMIYHFLNSSDDKCKTDGAIPWKAEEVV